MSEDSLNVNRMNVKPGGKQAIMRPGWFIRNGLKFTQHMVFTGGPNKGLAKGLKAVCEERFGADSVLVKGLFVYYTGCVSIKCVPWCASLLAPHF